jgi:hypothetical protein
MTETQRRAIVDFCRNRISKTELDAALGFDLNANPRAIFQLLNDGARSRDASSIECALILAERCDQDIDLIPTLIEFLRASWHYHHEDIAFTLQQLRDPRAIEALYETALTKHDYHAYDDGHALARKCTWALADIGTPEALEKLQSPAKSGDPEIAAYAKKRIDRWAAEKARKGPPRR